MKHVGVIGYPLEQSLSPTFQQAAIDHLGLDIAYESWPTPPDGLETRVIGLRSPVVLGANVTIPHKQAIIPLLDRVDDLAQSVGAVNTIVNRDASLFGYNTDVAGFLRALREDGGFDPGGRRAVVAGAGGAARAIVVALAEANAESVTVINRTYGRASKLVNDLRPTAAGTSLTALPDLHASWAAAMAASDVLINCTSVGSAGNDSEGESPVPVETLRSSTFVCDIVYRPEETLLMRLARKRGSRVLGGLPMLVYQGATSFEMWTDVPAPVEVMFTAARTALAAEVA